MSGPATAEALLESVRKVGREFAAVHAADVDQKSRFPIEALNGLKEAKLLSVLVPRELGGQGLSLSDAAAMCEELGRHCSASGMILAMHHIQVACIVRHGLTSAVLRDYLQELSQKQLLIASVTSEVGIGGDMRQSACALVRDGETVSVRKEATTISYGEHADDLLLTCRRAADAPPSDQLLVLLRKADLTLEKKGVWDTLGMRGTCSPGFVVTGKAPAGAVLPVPFAEIAAQTMVPTSHTLWSHLWLGMATEAVAKARLFVREAARRTPGQVPPTAQRLAELWSELQAMRSTVKDAMAMYQALADAPARASELTALGFALRMNNLKVMASQQVVEMVHRALLICGIAGYKNDSKFSLGRLLRDSHSAALMVGNDRVLAANASLLLVHKED